MNFELSVQTAEPLHIQVERFLRRQIETGELKPSERIPSTNELVSRWGVDRVTIQKAMARLKADNLLKRWPGRGTFVKGIGKGVIGLLTSQDLTNETAHFDRAMVQALEKTIGRFFVQVNSAAHPVAGRAARNSKAAATTTSGQWTARVYDRLTGLAKRGDPARHPVCQRLIEDFRSHPFRGWVEIGTPRYLFERFDFGQAGQLPSVRLGPPDENADVALDMADFIRQSAAFFARKGLRKIVYLGTCHSRAKRQPDLEGWPAAAETGLAAPTVVELPSEKPGPVLERAALEITLRLAQKWERERAWPDGVLVSDDIAMRGVALALFRYWPTLTTRPRLLTFANEGVELHYGLPVSRWENPIAETARRLLERLGQRLAGQTPPADPVLLKGRLKEEA
ncbi:MAG: GntR family transcriptional regulator [Verrucomicrobia bacterium]|nr:GntR family transcriptional regulator [Verrucomicrobiota bacterium]